VHINAHTENEMNRTTSEPEAPWTDTWKVEVEGQPDDPDPGIAQLEVDLQADSSVFTRLTDPFLLKQVDTVLDAIKIGDNLSLGQRVIVQDLLKEYADCFALSMSEVHVVPGAVHKVNVPEGKTFNTKV